MALSLPATRRGRREVGSAKVSAGESPAARCPRSRINASAAAGCPGELVRLQSSPCLWLGEFTSQSCLLKSLPATLGFRAAPSQVLKCSAQTLHSHRPPLSLLTSRDTFHVLLVCLRVARGELFGERIYSDVSFGLGLGRAKEANSESEASGQLKKKRPRSGSHVRRAR